MIKNRILTYETDSGTISFEVDESAPMRGATDSPIENKVHKKFESALSTIQVIGKSVLEQLEKLAKRPDEVNVKVGVKFTTEAGAIIAKTSAEGNIELSLTWKKKDEIESMNVNRT